MKSTEGELAAMLSKLSGSGYENCLSAVRKAAAIDQFGNVRSSALDGLAGGVGISNSVLASALSKVTGMLHEDALREVNGGSDRMAPVYRHGWGSSK